MVQDKGIIFGSTNGIITLMSLICGLYTTKVNKIGMIGAITALLITDPLCDAYSIYLSEEKTNAENAKRVGINAYLSQFLIQLSYLMIVLIFKKTKQIFVVSIFWSILLVISINLLELRKDKEKKEVIKNTIKDLSIYSLMVIFIYVVNYRIEKYFSKRKK